jgi:hypothetical protein
LVVSRSDLRLTAGGCLGQGDSLLLTTQMPFEVFGFVGFGR